MAIVTTDIGSIATRAITTQTLTIPANIPAGSLIVVFTTTTQATLSVTVAGSGTTGLTSGGTAGLQSRVDYYANASVINSGSAIVATTTSSASIAVSAFYVTGHNTATPFDSATTSATTGTTASITGSSAASTSQTNELAISYIADLGPSTDTFNQDTAHGWTSPPPTRAGTTGGTASTDITVQGGTVAVGAPAAFTFSGSLSTARSWNLILLSIQAVPLAVTTLGSTSAKAVTAANLTLSTAVPAGSLIVVAYTSSTTNQPTPTDSAGNTYQLMANPANGAQTNAYYAWNCKALNSGQTINIAGSTSGAWASGALFATGVLNNADPRQTPSPQNTGSTATPTSGATPTPSTVSALTVGFLGINGPSGDTFTQASGYTDAFPRVGTTGGGTTTNVALAGGTKISSASENYNPAITSRAWGDCAGVFLTVPLGPPTGTLTATQANQTLSAGGWSTNRGTLSATQAAQTLSAAGWSTNRGTLTATQANETLSAAGGPRVSGTLAAAQAAQTLSAAGTVVSGAPAMTSVVVMM